MHRIGSILGCVIISVLLLPIAAEAHAGMFSKYSKKRVSFIANEVELCGTLVIPGNAKSNTPVLIFVHGDGAVPADSYGYFAPIWSVLAEQGIASFSWDKPGVGDSKGNWLTQDMSDRAAEVDAAYNYLKKSERIKIGSVGVIGFSQAGWVLPKLSDKNWVDYIIFVSTAVNWVEQSHFLTRQRLLAEGVTNKAEIEAAITQNKIMDELLFSHSFHYDDYLKMSNTQSSDVKVMSKGRFTFVKNNISEDATARLAEIRVPVLALFGSDDLNIDVENSVATYSKVFTQSKIDYKLKVFRNSTHSLTKSEHFNKPIPGLLELIKMNWLGENIFVDGALREIVAFAASSRN